jgi:DNA-binding HxlR family transcriptional regulator
MNIRVLMSVKVLEDRLTRDVFVVLANAKSLRRNQLMLKLDNSSAVDLDSIIIKLEQADLIKVKSGPIPELSLYYLTAQGVEICRELLDLE